MSTCQMKPPPPEPPPLPAGASLMEVWEHNLRLVERRYQLQLFWPRWCSTGDRPGRCQPDPETLEVHCDEHAAGRTDAHDHPYAPAWRALLEALSREP